jgi:catechol 2,3-dioxygenase-like lactoylglutathione lyase family enzyme
MRSNMTVVDFSHVAVGVRDMESSVSFYRDVVGLDVVRDAEETVPVEGRPPIIRRAVYLRWNENPHAPFLVLDEVIDQELPWSPKRMLGDMGVHHFCFRVDDVDAVLERSRAAGVTILRGPLTGDTLLMGLRSGGECKSLFLSDPDGNAVQVDEILSLAEEYPTA